MWGSGSGKWEIGNGKWEVKNFFFLMIVFLCWIINRVTQKKQNKIILNELQRLINYQSWAELLNKIIEQNKDKN